MKKLLPLFFLPLLFQPVLSQNRTIDSLENLLTQSLPDTARVKVLIDLCWEHKPSAPAIAFKYVGEALSHAQQSNYPLGKAVALLSYGALYEDKGEFHTALKYYLNSLEIREKINNKKGIAACLNNIGNIYSKQNQIDNALASYQKALELYEELGYQKQTSPFLNNIAIIYRRKGDIKKSLEYHFKALKIREQLGDQYQIAQSLSNIGNLYIDKKEYDTALEYYLKAVAIQRKIDDKNGLTVSLNSIGALYINLNQPEDARYYIEQAISIGHEIDVKEELARAYFNSSQIDSLQGDYKQAYFKYQLYSTLKDSVFNSENSEQLAEMQTKYETEKKEQLIKLKEAQLIKQQLEVDKQTNQRNGFIGGFALMLALAGVSYRSYRNKRKAHEIITRQKSEVEEQKAIVDEKNKDILDSINYAKRIQVALLKEEQHVSKHLPEHFILFEPKDIVSGDFYWSMEKQGYLYLAAVDCTGHGVPGAFMSMLGIAFLNEITAMEDLLTPAEILDRLREKVIKELNQTGKKDESKDGMDISLIRLNLTSKKIEWSGANNPLWVISPALTLPEGEGVLSLEGDKKGGLFEIKPDKQPIGFYHEPKPFTTHALQLQKGDTFYLFTDGYADQFGGEKGKKFKYSKLKELLLTISEKPLSEQKQILNETFETWKGNLEQVDDVCVIGVRI